MEKLYSTMAGWSWLFILFACFQYGHGQISGSVTDEVTGKPIAKARIWIGDSSPVLSDAEGRFNLIYTDDFPVRLTVQKSGYENYSASVENAAQNLRVLLQRFATEDISEITITARRREETAQQVPIPINVISGKRAEDAGAFNVNRLKEMVPSVQLYSSNPRNTAISIRGLGTTFGLTNDGIDPGVGFYVDGVFYARPAAATLDFIDVERIEVLRGPQGTLFGKNTTAGAFNITTRKPSFKTGLLAETSYGNLGYIQAKVSFTGPLSKTLAGRFSFSGTQRDGTVYNIRTQQKLNDLNNLGARGQLLFKPNENLEINLTGDFNRQRPQGYAQVIAGVVATKRADYRQFNAIIADLGYTLPSANPFDRITDTDTPWRSYQDMGGISINADYKIGKGKLTSTTAWCFWDWNPSNDRDFLGLQGLAKSEAPSKHRQWSQEIRWSGDFSENVSAVFGVFAIWQKLRAGAGGQTEEAGKDQWRFSQNSTSALWATPGLLNGYGVKTFPSLDSFSGAVFGQVEWKFAEVFSILPGIRLNYDDKKIDFKRITYGGTDFSPADPNYAALIALRNSVYSNQEFQSSVDNTNFSGQFTFAYKPEKKYNLFATVSTGFKPVGLNLGGLPSDNGRVMTELAVIQPERTIHYELGVKSNPLSGLFVNLTLYNSDIKDYQAQVQAADLSINRGYLANAEKVRVRGAESDISYAYHNLYVYTNLAYSEGIYKKFTNAPQALENTGGPTFVDISGGVLPGISKWAGSTGAEFTLKGRFLDFKGNYFLAVDSYYRSSFSSSPTPSAFLNIPGYALFNARLGFRIKDGFSTFFWVRNIFNKDYFEQLLPGAGNSGHYAAVLGDPRTYGITIRYGL